MRDREGEIERGAHGWAQEGERPQGDSSWVSQFGVYPRPCFRFALRVTCSHVLSVESQRGAGAADRTLLSLLPQDPGTCADLWAAGLHRLREALGSAPAFRTSQLRAAQTTGRINHGVSCGLLIRGGARADGWLFPEASARARDVRERFSGTLLIFSRKPRLPLPCFLLIVSKCVFYFGEIRSS